MNAGPFRIAVVGAGRMGRVHLAALGRSAQVEVVAVVEPVDAIGGDLGSRTSSSTPSFRSIGALSEASARARSPIWVRT